MAQKDIQPDLTNRRILDPYPAFDVKEEAKFNLFEVNGESELLEALANPDISKIILNEDIELSSQLTISRSVEITSYLRKKLFTNNGLGAILVTGDDVSLGSLQIETDVDTATVLNVTGERFSLFDNILKGFVDLTSPSEVRSVSSNTIKTPLLDAIKLGANTTIVGVKTVSLTGETIRSQSVRRARDRSFYSSGTQQAIENSVKNTVNDIPVTNLGVSNPDFTVSAEHPKQLPELPSNVQFDWLIEFSGDTIPSGITIDIELNGNPVGSQYTTSGGETLAFAISGLASATRLDLENLSDQTDNFKFILGNVPSGNYDVKATAYAAVSGDFSDEGYRYQLGNSVELTVTGP